MSEIISSAITTKVSGGSAASGTFTATTVPTTVSIFSTVANEYARVFISASWGSPYQATFKVKINSTDIISKTTGSGGPNTGSIDITEVLLPPSSTLNVYGVESSGTASFSWKVSYVKFINSP